MHPAFELKKEFPFSESMEAYLEKWIPEKLMQSETLQRAFGLSAEQMEEIYSDAYSFYQQDCYEQAGKGFRWLVILNPFIARFWLGLGSCLHLLEKYEKALHAYAVVTLLESQNPLPHFHAFECYEALENMEEAQVALQTAYELSKASDDYRELREKIEIYHS